MSFSAKVKEELCNHISSSRHCRLAELAAIVTMSGSLDDKIWTMDSENIFIKTKVDEITRMLGLEKNTDEWRSALKIQYVDNNVIIDTILIERMCCKRAYLRGVFLAAGSLTNPEKGYHFEIVCEVEKQANIIMGILIDFGLKAKLIERKKYYVVYIKDSSMIVDALNVMGAHVSLMDMENVRILKDVRNAVNRRVNCETANLNKTVSAAVKQIEDIKYIEAEKGIKYLPENLWEIARLRLEEPELSLKDLGQMLNPPLGKSGVNHRLRKISEIAEELRRS